jgi:hypothetical protein
VAGDSDLRAQEELHQLLDWIESRPELSQIRAAANSAICNYQTDAPTPEQRITLGPADIKLPSKSGFDKFVEIIWVPGQNMRGKAYASQSSDASLSSVAKLMSLSTLWDFVTTIPVLSFPLQLSAGLLSIPIAGGLSFLLLWASNIAGENATNRSPGHISKATASLIAFVLLSAAKTAVSGVGTDLVIGTRGIQQEYASKLVNESLVVDRKNLEEKKATLFADPLLQEQSEKCDENTKYLAQIPRTDPGWQAAYLAEGGQYQDRIATIDQVKKKYGSPANMPSCLAVRVLKEEKNAQLNKPNQKLQELQEASKSLPPLAFLKTYYPQRYANAFIDYPNGDVAFRDGTLAVGEATSLFFTKLTNRPQLASLGFSLFTFAISVTLSASAAIMLFLVSRNREIKASFSPELEATKVAFLGKYMRLRDQESRE